MDKGWVYDDFREKIDYLAQICLILKAKFGDNPKALKLNISSYSNIKNSQLLPRIGFVCY